MTDPEYIYTEDGKERGLVVGPPRPCRLEGCTGIRYPVRWSDGKHTYPCSKGMKDRTDGQLQIG